MNYWILEIESNVAWREFRGRRRGGLFLLISVESSPPLVSPSSRSLFIPLLNTFLPPSFHNCGAISRLVASFIVDSIPPPNLPHPASLHLHNLRSFSPSLSLCAEQARTQTLKPSLTRSLYTDWYSDHSHTPVTTHSPAAMRINAGVLNILCSTNITPRRQNLSLSRSFLLFHSHDVVSAATNFIKNSITSPVTGTVTQTEGKKRLRDRDRPSREGK